MKTKKIIEALTKWSPKGLCSDVLVGKDGKKPEGCAVGCLTMACLTGPTLREVLNAEGIKEFVSYHIGGDAKLTKASFLRALAESVQGSFAGNLHHVQKIVLREFDLTNDEMDAIMEFNDNCLGYSSAEEARESFDSKLPRDLCRTIWKLRNMNQQYGDC